MAQVLQEVRKRALADVSNPKSRPAKIGKSPPDQPFKPLTAPSAAAQAPAAAMAAAGEQHSSIQASAGDGAASKAAPPAGAPSAAADEPSSPVSQGSNASCDTECDSPAAPDRSPVSPPPCQAEQQSAYLLLKACEREEAAEERADAAETALAETNSKLAATEAALAAAQNRLQLLEVSAAVELSWCWPVLQAPLYLSACGTVSAGQDSTLLHTWRRPVDNMHYPDIRFHLH